jgi:biopolymer transport protein ExbD
MAASITPTGKGRRRPVDAAINLVPFIDLLSCCIAFLLITAVWSQVAAIETHTGGSSDETAAPAAPPPTLYVGRDEFQLRIPGGSTLTVEPAQLTTTLRAHHTGDALIIESVDGVPYDRLVRGLDAARAAGFVQLAIGPSGG